MAHKVILPPKKIISRSFLNSGTLIVIILSWIFFFQSCLFCPVSSFPSSLSFYITVSSFPNSLFFRVHSLLFCHCLVFSLQSCLRPVSSFPSSLSFSCPVSSFPSILPFFVTVSSFPSQSCLFRPSRFFRRNLHPSPFLSPHFPSSRHHLQPRTHLLTDYFELGICSLLTESITFNHLDQSKKKSLLARASLCNKTCDVLFLKACYPVEGCSKAC